MIRKVDWAELEPYQNNKYRSFEELCYQIAKGLYGEKGRFTSIDDSGGGDGVEFYLTLPNGDQWGWQAKFYYPEKRLNKSNRKQSIITSLKKACEIHPRLKKWILCTPTNFTPEEQTWFDDTLPQFIPEDMEVELEHWGDSDFNDWLSKPCFSGKLNYFFGKLELDLDWFKGQFNKQVAGVGSKFDLSLHTETDVDAEIHALLGDEKFVEQITKSIEKLEEELADLEDAVDNLNKPVQKDIEWDVTKKEKVADAAKSLQNVLIKTIDQFKQAEELLKKKMLFEAQKINWEFVIKRLADALKTYRTVIDESDISKIKYIGESGYGERILNDAKWLVHRPDSIIANLLDDFLYYDRCILINKSNLNILGDAGIGKTHIACNICDDRLKNGLPALFVRGSQFTTEQIIEGQLQDILGISRSYSWHDFLQALSAAAEAYHTRIPLIIDGLNESTHNGAFSKIWKNGLKGFVHEIAQAKNVVLITTCRKSYKKAIWGDEFPPNCVYAEGFNIDEIKQEAIDKYFNAYKIKTDPTGTTLAHFQHPIYLKIFCESKNPTRETEVDIPMGDQTLFEIFDEYLEQCNKKVCKRLGLHPNANIVQSALDKMVEYLWQHRSRHIPLEDLIRFVDGRSHNELNWQSSKTHAIESEGLLLMYRDWSGDTEVVRFTFDLLGGYLIARYLVQQTPNRRQGYFHHVILNIFGEERKGLHPILNVFKKGLMTLFPIKGRRFLHYFWSTKTAHPMYEDIGRCLAALFPIETGEYLHDLTKNKIARHFSIRALFEISPQYITEDSVNLVASLFDRYQEGHKSFFKLAETTVGHPNHPFNAPFWSERLLRLSMLERDLSWTEHVREDRKKFEKIVIRIEETCQNQDISELSAKRLHLLAEYIMWVLTSTVRPLRDQATRALYRYGRRFPQEFSDLVIKSFSINDPYVSERMLAATYGIAMARQNDRKDTSFVKEVLPLYARQLYENMFKPSAPHATTHILARDYAKRTIDIALMHHPNLLTDDERERITPPFTDGGIREWGENENKEEAPPPVQMDFEIYTLSRLIKFDSRDPDEHKRLESNVYWRIYDLGFTNESFVEIDSRIAEENRRYGRHNEDKQKIDRYRKKYSWIAFYELAGFRQDNGLLPDRCEDARILDADIDPSFSGEHREYNLVTGDYLGDRSVSVEEWISNTLPPDLTSYLKVDHLCGEKGFWMLLDGYLSQKDDQARRDMFIFSRGLIVKSREADEIIEILKNQEKIDGHSIPACPKDHRTFAGEIPWCNTYPPNNWEAFSFLVRKYTIPKKQFELLRGGEPISLIDDFELWGTTKKLIEKGDEKRLNELLHERNLEITVQTVDEERSEHKDFEVLVPVRGNYWEESCSIVIPPRTIALPAREISDCLNLYRKPHGFDLFEKENGRCASITFQYGEKWGERQHFTYLRQDLLQRYLAEIDSELIWVIWGNRRLVSENHDDPYENFQEVKTYSEIMKLSSN